MTTDRTSSIRNSPGAYSTSAPASWYACRRRMVSARSSTPRMWFSARPVTTRPAGRLDRGGDAVASKAEVVDRPFRVAPVVLDRRPGRARLGGCGDRRRDARRVVGEAVLEVGVHRQRRRRGDVRGVGDRLVAGDAAVGPPERGGERRRSSWRWPRTRVDSSSLAEPASQALGITSGVAGPVEVEEAGAQIGVHPLYSAACERGVRDPGPPASRRGRSRRPRPARPPRRDAARRRPRWRGARAHPRRHRRAPGRRRRAGDGAPGSVARR